MNLIKNIKWVALLTFVLGYVVSTATAGNEAAPKGTPDTRKADSQEAAEKNATSAAPRWASVDIGEAMPAYFADSQPNVINRAEGLNQIFDVLCKSGRPLRVLQLGDSHVAGKCYPQAVRSTLQAAWGEAAPDSLNGGLVYKFIGKNGARATDFATAHRMEQVTDAAPDLIILSFGTNECHSMRYDATQHRAQLERLYSMLKETCPDAVIMMTTPPGDYLTSRSVRYVRNRNGKRRRIVRTTSRINPMSQRCAAVLEDFGTAHGLPVWDLNSIAGGTDAVRNWSAGKLMRGDRIHFTPEGYALQGRMLAAAILSAYNDYVKLDSRS